MRERANALPAADVEAILAAASGGELPAVKVARERLGWSLNEVVSLVYVLRHWAEPSAAADRGRDDASPSGEVSPPGPSG
jgi:hypothetical protein